MNFNTLKAIFRRDFVSYFSSPTGYVFICVFVVLSSLATFWPPDFFANNLANLDQLSRWLPFIMLVFIPAITMSMWAEERRQGTDELLLTIPASDSDVVLGKYLAGVAIFTVSLLFSALAIFLVFQYGLGSPDPGLFVSTYIGYWFIGIAMIAVGMVASFLTANLTVGFILGTLFNLPLALFGVADWFVKDPIWAQRVRRWSAVEQFRDFERGVISISGVAYFLLLAAVMLYICMVLIGRRHWQAREDENSLLGHYLIRGLSLLAIAFGLTALLQENNWLRADISSEKLSTLSDDAQKLIKQLGADDDVRTIKIDAYVSPQVPQEYVATKLNLLSTLEELKALSSGKIRVVLHETSNYGPEAEKAEKNYGITPRELMVGEGAQSTTEEFLMGVAFRCGPDKVVVPFMNKGMPAEYELVRSIMTVAQPQRLKLGVVDTGVPMIDSSSAGLRDSALVRELKKQYNVTRIDPVEPITEKVDVLLAVQPSMMDPQAFDHFVDAVKSGVPTAVFEDPFPWIYKSRYGVAGTGEPKIDPMMARMGGGAQQKGDLQQLWRLLGIEFTGSQLVFQDYKPEASVANLSNELWNFIDEGNGALSPFGDDNPVTTGLNQVLLIYAGSMRKAIGSELEFAPLAVSGAKNSGLIDVSDLEPDTRGVPTTQDANLLPTSDSYIVSAEITGLAPLDELFPETPADAEIDPADDPDAIAKRTAAEENRPMIRAIVTADADCVIDDFFAIREQGDEQFLPVTQNVAFVLNIIDRLAGDERFMEIRKRAREHRTLTRIDEATSEYRIDAAKEEKKAIEAIQAEIDAAQSEYEEKVSAIEQRTDLSERDRFIRRLQLEQDLGEKLKRDLTALKRDMDRTEKKIEYDLEQKSTAVQNLYKMIALVLPPIPPLLLAVWVFFRRREAERQGVARERLR